MRAVPRIIISIGVLVSLSLVGSARASLDPVGAANGIQAGATPQHSVGGDWNGDGRTDLAVANVFDDTVHVLHGNNSGDFDTVQIVEVGLNPEVAGFPAVPTNLPRYLRAEDINRDGFTDLVVLCSGDAAIFQFESEPSLQVLFNLGMGEFAPWAAAPATPNSTEDEFAIEFVLGKFVGDDYLDAAVACIGSRTVNYLRGDGTGDFELVQTMPVSLDGRGPTSLATADITFNGRDDLVVATQRGLLWFEQIAPGAFAPHPLPVRFDAFPDMSLQSVIVGDLSGDGEWDVAASDGAGRVFCFEGVRRGPTAAQLRILQDSSLSAPRGLAAVLWDDDAIPDLAVANSQADSITIFCSGASVDVRATAPRPRRLSVADIDNDGFEDLMTSNEGDLAAPANADVSVALNPGVAGAGETPERTHEYELTDGDERHLARPQGLASRTPGLMWVLKESRDKVVLTDIFGAQLSEIEFDYVAGGMDAQLGGGLFVVERFGAAIHTYGPLGDGTAPGMLSFALDPGVHGFTGLAHDPINNRFFIAQPELSVIWEIDAGGNVVTARPVARPAWNLAWNQSLPGLMATHPGRHEVRMYLNGDSTFPPFVINLSAASSLFRELGPVGISSSFGPAEFTAINSAGSWARFDFAGNLLMADSVAPLSRVGAIAYDAVGDELFVLGVDGMTSRIDLDSGTLDVLPTWQLNSSRPDFRPTGISFRESDNRILISSDNPRDVARFTRNGFFLGFESFSGDAAAPLPPAQGLAIDLFTGELLFRSSHRLFSENDTTLPPVLAGGTTNDFSAAGGRYVTDLDGGALALATRADTPERLPMRLEPVRRVGGLSSYREAEEFARLVEDDDKIVLEIYATRQVAPASGWLEYE